jgi:hypothetical protein
MVDGTFNNPTPQFGTAEYLGSPGGDHCQFCHQPVAGNYYRANGAMACAGCAEKMRGELAKDTHAAYVRAIVFGVGAAILGMILYATFAIVTGIVIGYASLAVGWLVGKAILKGSGGVTGRRYQITAVALTYIAVALARVPIWIHYAPRLHVDIFTAVIRLIPIAFVFPFIRFADNPFGGVIGLVILFVGLSIAWRLTAAAPMEIFGPFEDSRQPAR